MQATLRRAADAIRQLGIAWDPEDERTPVLAIGSNAGPEQLLRKYPPAMFPGGVAIPCVRCMLPDFDVAFAPLISSYGSCTGAPQASRSNSLSRMHSCTSLMREAHVKTFAIPCVRCMLPDFHVAAASLISSCGFCTSAQPLPMAQALYLAFVYIPGSDWCMEHIQQFLSRNISLVWDLPCGLSSVIAPCLSKGWKALRSDCRGPAEVRV